MKNAEVCHNRVQSPVSNLGTLWCHADDAVVGLCSQICRQVARTDEEGGTPVCLLGGLMTMPEP